MTKEWNGTQWSRKIHFRGGPASNTCLLQILKHWKTRKKTHHSPVPLTGNCRLVICNCRTVTPAPDTGLCPYCRADLWLLVTGRWLERPALAHWPLWLQFAAAQPWVSELGPGLMSAAGLSGLLQGHFTGHIVCSSRSSVNISMGVRTDNVILSLSSKTFAKWWKRWQKFIGQSK